jgi:hypothetical protein
MRLLLSESIRNSVSSSSPARRLHSAMDPRQPESNGRKKLLSWLSVKSRLDDEVKDTWTVKIAKRRKKA